MVRSGIVILACVGVIAGAVAHLVLRPRSAAERERDEAGWRICAECGHEWHMELGAIASQMTQNPDGVGAVRCPECGAWRGMARAKCPKCHKCFPSLVPVETDDGIRLDKQRSCPHCGFVFGSADVPGDGAGNQ